MKPYEMPDVKIIFFISQDIITNSQSETADDLGGWNSDCHVPHRHLGKGKLLSGEEQCLLVLDVFPLGRTCAYLSSCPASL